MILCVFSLISKVAGLVVARIYFGRPNLFRASLISKAGLVVAKAAAMHVNICCINLEPTAVQGRRLEAGRRYKAL